MGSGLKVGEVMTKNVISADENTSVQRIAELMLRNKIGSVVVTHEATVKGIITKGDIVRKVVAENKDANDTKAKDIMTNEVLAISQEKDVLEAAKLMRKHGVKRLPVVNEQREIVGIISESDIVRLLPSIIDLIEEKLLIG